MVAMQQHFVACTLLNFKIQTWNLQCKRQLRNKTKTKVHASKLIGKIEIFYFCSDNDFKLQMKPCHVAIY